MNPSDKTAPSQTEALAFAFDLPHAPKKVCFTGYVKVAFFRGTSLRPVPPGDAAQLATWIRQAAALPGWVP